MDPSPTRLRQIALVAKDLERARHLLTSVLGTEVIYEDPAVAQWGLKNILVPLGGDIIEVISPFKTGTPASRHLAKRGEGGYMIIMQTQDAPARRRYLQANNLAQVIFAHDFPHSSCIQYHPRGIKGGMMPELDSHRMTEDNSDPIGERFSLWHAAGTGTAYVDGMKRAGDLWLKEVVLRLKEGDEDVDAAARQWEDLFGVKRRGDGVDFTNAKMRFVKGEKAKSEGLAGIVVGVVGRSRLDGILERAKEEGFGADDEGRLHILGVSWTFVLLDGSGTERSKL